MFILHTKSRNSVAPINQPWFIKPRKSCTLSNLIMKLSLMASKCIRIELMHQFQSYTNTPLFIIPLFTYHTHIMSWCSIICIKLTWNTNLYRLCSIELVEGKLAVSFNHQGWTEKKENRVNHAFYWSRAQNADVPYHCIGVSLLVVLSVKYGFILVFYLVLHLKVWYFVHS